MAFTGRAKHDTSTMDGGLDDVADLVGLIAPFDTPLLDALGSPRLPVQSTRHEWDDGAVKRQNFTQIFTEAVSISGSMDAVGLHAVEREFDYQVIQRLRELMRSLEQTVVNGFKAGDAPRRTMGGLLQYISGDSAVRVDALGELLTAAHINAAAEACKERGGAPDLLVCNGFNKRRISQMLEATRQHEPDSGALRNTVDKFEGDHGTQRVVLSRWVPQTTVLLLDSSKIQVMPLQGRSFFVKPLAESGDFRKAQLIGEYTLEIVGGADGKHGVIANLSIAQ